MRRPPDDGSVRPGRSTRSACARLVLAGGVALPLFAACTPGLADWRHGMTEASNRGVSDLPNISSSLMIEKYGPPDRVETLRLVWENRGPWKRLVVWDQLGFLDNDRAGRNIEGTIAYAVSEDKRGALASFSRGIHVSADGVELSARSPSEERNFLMLNLADAIVKGLTTPEAARDTYLRTIRLADAGKSSPTMKGLLFRPAGPRRPPPPKTRVGIGPVRP